MYPFTSDCNSYQECGQEAEASSQEINIKEHVVDRVTSLLLVNLSLKQTKKKYKSYLL